MIKIYKNESANAIFFEDANGVQFINSLQATSDGVTCSVTDIAKNAMLVAEAPSSDFVDEDDNSWGADGTEVCNNLNAIFQDSGTATGNPPEITSSLTATIVQGQTLNYELTANYGVGYEWDLSAVNGITTVEGHHRKLVGGSGLVSGTYNIPVKAINYNGEDSETLVLTVSTPPFANTKSVNFNNNDYLGANAGILDNVLGRDADDPWAGDAWTVSLFFKPGTASNASQTIFYFGNQDVANQGYIQLKYNGQSSSRRIELRYGSNNNRLNLITPNNSLTQEGQQNSDIPSVSSTCDLIISPVQAV